MAGRPVVAVGIGSVVVNFREWNWQIRFPQKLAEALEEKVLLLLEENNWTLSPK